MDGAAKFSSSPWSRGKKSARRVVNPSTDPFWGVAVISVASVISIITYEFCYIRFGVEPKAFGLCFSCKLCKWCVTESRFCLSAANIAMTAYKPALF